MIKNILFDADDTLWRSQDYYDYVEELITDTWGKAGMQSYRQKIHANIAIMDTGPNIVLASLYDVIAEKESIINDDRKLMKDVKAAICDHIIEPLDDVETTLQKLQPHYNMMIVTKGGLFEQERKINASGFLPYFNMGYEVMVRKDAEEYCTRIFEKHDLMADETVMVGNSVKSDILPAIACGAHAIHIPYHRVWNQEIAD